MKNIKLLILFILGSIQMIAVGQDKIVQIANDLPLDQIRGEYGVWYKTPGCSQKNGVSVANKITKPFIVCEGFDLEDSGLSFLYSGQLNQSGLLTQLRNDGYDIIILDLLDNTKSISKNSRLVQKLVNEINTEVQQNNLLFGTPVYRPMLMGISMGGLIVRHALMSMERDGVDHKTEKMFTLDTPHQGANVPLGLLNMSDILLGPLDEYQKFRSILSRFNLPDPITALESKYLSESRFTLSTDAAYEMAINNPGANPTRTLFLKEMRKLGNYPSKTRNIGIACGASVTNQPGMRAGQYLFNWERDIFCVLDRTIGLPFGLNDIDVRICPLTFSARTWTMPGNDLRQIMRFNAGSEIGINQNFVGTGLSRYSFSPNARDFINAPLTRDFNVDHVPGGYLGMPLEGLKQKIDDADIDWDIYLGFEVCDPTGILGCTDITIIDKTIHIENILGTLEYTERFSFVPTVSALDLNDHNWNTNVSNIGNYPHNKLKTPFDAVYWSQQNHFHAQFPTDDGNDGEVEMSKFAFSELSPAQLFVQNRVFESGYTNTFEARDDITVGKNVDLVPSRTQQGEVLMKSGVDITFSIESDEELIFEDGVDIEIGAEISVIENNLDNCTAPSLGKDLFMPVMQRPSKFSIASNKKQEVTMVTAGGVSSVEVTRDNTPVYSSTKYKRPVNVDNIVEFNAWIYPTTTKGDVKLRLELPTTETLRISIMDAMGQDVLVVRDYETYILGTQEIVIPSSSLSSGLYLVTIRSDRFNETIKLIKE